MIHVAEKCGFNHLGLFNTCFKKRFGASPEPWRKAIAQASAHAGATGASGSAFQSHDLGLQSEKTDGSWKESGEYRPVERVALGGLLKDIAAVKSRFGPQTFGPKGISGSGIAAKGSRDAKARVGT